MKYILFIVLLTLNTEDYELLHLPFETVEECISMQSQITMALSKELAPPGTQFLAASRCMEVKNENNR